MYSISLNFKQDWYSCDFGNVGPKLDYPIFFLTMKKYIKIWSVISIENSSIQVMYSEKAKKSIAPNKFGL